MNKRFEMLMHNIARKDCVTLAQKDREYGSSWKKRGGVGAFMMLARKWDRITQAICGATDDCDRWDIIQGALNSYATHGEQGLLDDIGDLRRYLLLVETEVRLRLREDNVQEDPEWAQELEKLFNRIAPGTDEPANMPPAKLLEDMAPVFEEMDKVSVAVGLPTFEEVLARARELGDFNAAMDACFPPEKMQKLEEAFENKTASPELRSNMESLSNVFAGFLTTHLGAMVVPHHYRGEQPSAMQDAHDAAAPDFPDLGEHEEHLGTVTGRVPAADADSPEPGSTEAHLAAKQAQKQATRRAAGIHENCTCFEQWDGMQNWLCPAHGHVIVTSGVVEIEDGVCQARVAIPLEYRNDVEKSIWVQHPSSGKLCPKPASAKSFAN